MHAQRIFSRLGIRLTDKTLPVLFRQLRKHASKWREIGLHLGFLPGELSNIEARPSLFQGAPVSYLGALLEESIQLAPGDSRGSTSFTTLESLKAALVDTGLAAAARDLKIETGSEVAEDEGTEINVCVCFTHLCKQQYTLSATKLQAAGVWLEC